ncbi:hypothetical protein HNQ35_002431 [Cerasibacillus quisquiliarum]|uniref:Uncharacterized protein n=1 Tax=Cerasibacillus quisquiliarum TaxID=227865 RepID=A0A511V1X8_9BACI|nr:hypothetical protein [Cerasibacillus quisquiliarum]MBB5147214.1 hypothetical protein [Cerasibacillus quisquiliarum]GEN32031.1 hypothetical protein CQU01_22690 [Cerasibacillus quisquiliarum]
MDYIKIVLDWIGAYLFLLGAIAVGILWLVMFLKKKNSLVDNLVWPAFTLVFLAAHFFGMKPFIIDQRNDHLYLAEHGVVTEGCIRSLEDTAVYVNGMPVLKIVMQYRFDGNDYETVIKQEIPYAILPEIRVGQCYALLVDPDDPKRVTFN